MITWAHVEYLTTWVVAPLVGIALALVLISALDNGR